MHVGRLARSWAEYYRTEAQPIRFIVTCRRAAFRLVFDARPALRAFRRHAARRIGDGRHARGFSARELALAAAAARSPVGTDRLFRYAAVDGQKVDVAAPGARTVDVRISRELWGPLLTSDRPLMVTLATRPRPPAR